MVSVGQSLGRLRHDGLITRVGALVGVRAQSSLVAFRTPRTTLKVQPDGLGDFAAKRLTWGWQAMCGRTRTTLELTAAPCKRLCAFRQQLLECILLGCSTLTVGSRGPVAALLIIFVFCGFSLGHEHCKRRKKLDTSAKA